MNIAEIKWYRMGCVWAREHGREADDADAKAAGVPKKYYRVWLRAVDVTAHRETVEVES